MTDPRGDHPLPHAELASQTPLLFTVKKGGVLSRHHRATESPLYLALISRPAQWPPVS